MTKASKVIVLMIAPILATFVLLSIFELRKAYYDWQVQKLCETDGGDKIFQVEHLNATDYGSLLNAFGQLDIPLQRASRPNTPVVRVEVIEYLREANPRVTRFELQVVRTSDKKTLGTRTTYSRVGGDLFAFHPSIFACPKLNSDFYRLVVQQLATARVVR